MPLPSLGLTTVAVEEGTANKDLAGSPTKTSMRTQRDVTLITYGFRFQVVALSQCLDETRVAWAEEVGRLSKKFAIFASCRKIWSLADTLG